LTAAVIPRRERQVHIPVVWHSESARLWRAYCADMAFGRAWRSARQARPPPGVGPDRGRTVTFRGELRTAKAYGRAGLVLRVTSPGQSTPRRAADPDPVSWPKRLAAHLR